MAQLADRGKSCSTPGCATEEQTTVGRIVSLDGNKYYDRMTGDCSKLLGLTRIKVLTRFSAILYLLFVRHVAYSAHEV